MKQYKCYVKVKYQFFGDTVHWNTEHPIDIPEALVFFPPKYVEPEGVVHTDSLLVRVKDFEQMPDSRKLDGILEAILLDQTISGRGYFTVSFRDVSRDEYRTADVPRQNIIIGEEYKLSKNHSHRF